MSHWQKIVLRAGTMRVGHCARPETVGEGYCGRPRGWEDTGSGGGRWTERRCGPVLEKGLGAKSLAFVSAIAADGFIWPSRELTLELWRYFAVRHGRLGNIECNRGVGDGGVVHKVEDAGLLLRIPIPDRGGSVLSGIMSGIMSGVRYLGTALCRLWNHKSKIAPILLCFTKQ